jgi:hypothetical protein
VRVRIVKSGTKYFLDRVSRALGGRHNTAKIRDIELISGVDADPNGRVFCFDGNLYRGILPHRVPFYKSVLRKGVIDQLVDKGLVIETAVAGMKVDAFPLILKHRRVPFVTYPFEWCASMLRDAALTTIDLQKELTLRGLQLHDGHAYNLLFDRRPRYIDLGSIVEADKPEVWQAWPEFCRYFLYPLALAEAGQDRLARVLLMDFGQGVTGAVAGNMCPNLALHCHHRELAGAGSTLEDRLRFLDVLREDIESITLPRKQTAWSEYYGNQANILEPSPDWRPKQRGVWDLLARLRPRSVTDLGSNRGLYGQMAARHGASVAAVDNDHTAITDLYEDLRSQRFPITPVVMDLSAPSPAMGPGQMWRAGRERLRSEMCLALALVHHMVFKMYLNFERIAELVAGFAERWLVIEFIPKEDRYVSEWWDERYGWYTTDNFVRALKRHFRSVEITKSDPDPRILLLCTV